MLNFFKKVVIINFILILSTFIFAGEFSLGTDIYNRYVWRGTDFGNSAAIQPYLAYSEGPLEIGAWGSWSVNGAPAGNENDIYMTYTYEFMSFTITDYFFPDYTGDDQIDEFGENGGHTIELSAGLEVAGFSILAAANVAGNDPDNSKYAELGYGFYEKDDVSASVFAGVGDGFYSSDGDLAVVNIGLSVSKNKYSAAYIINPDQRTSFLTFGISL
ncbi:MAG: hypothetical protein K9M80_00365 [Candidatus Marinimicrobia bacterium]|nr:hypothetical protein [Candidatus Neomarinimicrobiota bacterium]